MKLSFYDFRWQLLVVTLTWPAIGSADASHTDPLSNEPSISSNDASPDGEVRQTLSSAQLVADILVANPQLEIVQAIWQAANSRIEQASALDDPTLSHSLAPLTIGHQQSDFSQNTIISQKLPWPGKRRLRAEAAAFDAKAAKENVGSLRLLLMATAKTLFCGLVLHSSSPRCK
nr:TolC family protein [Methylomarinum sp. Ch1-1]MDP4521665.1 TolC family protein [Methylomarinum sp. Ch1-1]